MGRTQRVLALMLLHVALAHCFSWDIVVARSNKLEFYHERTLVYTAAPASHRIKWIIYEPVHDRVLFADRRNSKYSVAAFDIATKTTQPLIMKKTNRYYKRFAYDPATELLFGTRVNKIYSFPINSGNNNETEGDLVIDLGWTVPRELAVDSCGGYIYWTTSNTIERALINGSNREVIIDKDITVKQGLTIDSQKMYWIEYHEYEGGFSIESADLNGKNRRKLYSEVELDSLPGKLIVSKYFVYWLDSVDKAFFWQLPKNASNATDIKPNKISMAPTSDCSVYGYQDIATIYTIEERTQDVAKCSALKSLLPGYCDSVLAAADLLFCVNGTKVSGESRCECTQGYIGERCDVSVCHNYCYQGDCHVADGGLPKCRCNAGYSGERCEVNLCHDYCLNNGTCSLNNHSEPVCQCIGQHDGERCEVTPATLEPASRKMYHVKFHWLPTVYDFSNVPPNAIMGGLEGGDNTYIARFNDTTGLLRLVKYGYDKNLAIGYIPGADIVYYTGGNIEILCGTNAKWVKTESVKDLPENAFVTGRTSDGQPLYSCRVQIENDLVLGKADVRTNKCYLSYRDSERNSTSCEILVEPDDEI